MDMNYIVCATYRFVIKIEQCHEGGSNLLELYGLRGINPKSKGTFVGSLECSGNDQITALLQLAAVTDLSVNSNSQ